LRWRFKGARAEGAILFAIQSGERCQRSANAEGSGANRGGKLEEMVRVKEEEHAGEGTEQRGEAEAEGSPCGGGSKADG
jgi:hypothetical protein